MSGGHFDYRDFSLRDFADTIEVDIKTNDDVSPDGSYEGEGLHYSKESISYMRKIVLALKELGDLLHEYDYAVSGDNSEKSFLERARTSFLLRGEKAKGSSKKVGSLKHIMDAINQVQNAMGSLSEIEKKEDIDLCWRTSMILTQELSVLMDKIYSQKQKEVE